jgi:DEAD/DEAH box helicase domain-containing protein
MPSCAGSEYAIWTPPAAVRVMAYRGGYTPQYRRRIERDVPLAVIVAMSALNLGVEIGALNAVVSGRFPYDITYLR